MKSMKWLVWAMAAGVLAACAKPSPENKVVLDAQGSWRSVGKLHGGNMEVFYDTGSLQKQGNTVSLRSRLVVRDTDKEPYLETPHFKIAVNEWQMNCRGNTVRVTSSHFFDSKKQLLAKHEYSAQDTAAAKPQPDTPAQSLWQAACNGGK